MIEWHAADKDRKYAHYVCTYKLLDSESSSLREFYYDKDLVKRGEWIKVCITILFIYVHVSNNKILFSLQFTHSFKNYGEGLRKIKFSHGAYDGVVMVGASVTLEVNMYHDIRARKIKPFVA